MLSYYDQQDLQTLTECQDGYPQVYSPFWPCIISSILSCCKYSNSAESWAVCPSILKTSDGTNYQRATNIGYKSSSTSGHQRRMARSLSSQWVIENQAEYSRELGWSKSSHLNRKWHPAEWVPTSRLPCSTESSPWWADIRRLQTSSCGTSRMAARAVSCTRRFLRLQRMNDTLRHNFTIIGRYYHDQTSGHPWPSQPGCKH